MRFTTLAEMFAADATTPQGADVCLAGWQCIPARRSASFSKAPRTIPPAGASATPRHLWLPLRKAGPATFYVSSESEDITYSARVNPDGSLADLKPFAQRGGESVAVDDHGNVYVANGQIFVYSPLGKQIAEIDVPERPLQLVFGGPDRKTLFILAHHALFAAQLR